MTRRQWLCGGVLKLRQICLGLGILAGAWIASTSIVFGAESSATAKAIADEQVRRVLERETTGEIAERGQTLESALKERPNHAATRWQAGYVRWRNQWLKFDEVANLPDYQATLEAYDAARAKADKSVNSQLVLARWCREQGLEAQEKVHLANVIELEPSNLAARGRLGYVQAGRSWYTKRELAAAEKRSQETSKAISKWTPQLKQILAGLSKENARERAAAEQKLAAIKDPAALPAIEAVYIKAPEKIALKAVETVANMKSPEAAVSLAKFAIANPFNEVGIAAAEALQDKPEDSYIPPLLALLSTTIETRFEMYQSGNRLLYRQMFFRETEDHMELFGLQHTAMAQGGNSELQARAVALRSAGLQAAAADQGLRLAERNAEIQKLNKRVTDVLALATGAELSAEPQAWWQWWNDRNEVYLPNGKPLQSDYQVTSDVVNLPSVTAPPASIGSSGGSSQRAECLVAGTPIWTAAGSVAVDKLQPGDLVLAQHPETGELAYQAVIATTTRAAGPVLRIELGSDAIRASGGHPFWVVGKGWVLARHLKAGMRLRDAFGATQIKSVVDETQASEPTYNLVVADFHSYFVGASKVLSHDNSIRRPTSALVPGLVQR